MPDLVAQGPRSEDRWRRALPVGESVVLGRSGGGIWTIPWDERISRRHAELQWRDGSLRVRRLPQARNPIFVRGREQESTQLRPGEHFVIGQTTFTLTNEQARVSLDAPQPLEEQIFGPGHLEQWRFRHADQRIEVLGRLPELIAGATSDSELWVRLVNLLLVGLPKAGAVALAEASAIGSAEPSVEILHWDRRLATGEGFEPSQRLIVAALERRQTVLHLWRGDAAAGFTQRDAFDWAFCTPLAGDACRGQALYVAGNLASAGATPQDAVDLRDELKFSELVASIFSALCQMRQLQRQNASLSQFFAPAVMAITAGEDPEQVLQPRETDVVVLFCDLRGFSRRSEQHTGPLLALLERVSAALGAMTRHILDEGGVIGDFHGDAAMGFWGWPLAQDDAPLRAVRAALAIDRDFRAAAQRPGDALADFRVGIGLAAGRAVAGRIGSVDQVKVSVFGPVVNLASRLEGMTKLLHAPILLDEALATWLRRNVPAEIARCRRLGRVRPAGLDAAVEVSELLPPASESPSLEAADLAEYEAALRAFESGDWKQALQRLHRVPADDQAKDFLIAFIAQHQRTPPPGWDGVAPLASK